MPIQVVTGNLGILVYMIVGCLLFIISIAVGTFLTVLIKNKMNEKPLGTRQTCGDCYAMQVIVEKIPKMEDKQEVLRRTDLPQMTTTLAKIETTTKSLDERVKKLFTLIETDWKQEREELRKALKTAIASLSAEVQSHKEKAAQG